jgi:hypothetical protein
MITEDVPDDLKELGARAGMPGEELRASVDFWREVYGSGWLEVARRELEARAREPRTRAAPAEAMQEDAPAEADDLEDEG